MKLITRNLITLAALALALAPALALAQTSPANGVHVHANMYHDRSPHARDHTPVAHH